MCANVHTHLTYLSLIYLLAVQGKVLMLEYLHFSHTPGSLQLDG